MSTACSPSECHVMKARLCVSVGVCGEKLAEFLGAGVGWCDEKLAKLSRVGETDEHVAGSLTGSRYSELSCGADWSATSRKRTQPHGQPCAASTPPNFP